MSATLPAARSVALMRAPAAAITRAARWLIPDRRDGVVVLALLFGVWLSNVLGVVALLDSAASAAALHFAAHNLVNEAKMTLFVLLVARLTVGWPAHGWRRHGLVALTMAAALLAQAVVHRSFFPILTSFGQVGFSFSDPSIPLAVAAVWFPLGLLLAAQLHRSQLEREAEARLRVLLKEVRIAQQQHSEARLRMLQARIDPTLLFGMLERVRVLYVEAPERAETLLEELIVFLRAVLPRLHSAASTVGQEIAAADAYVRLRALADGQAAAIDIDAAAASDEPFPPGVLLPLVGGVLEQGSGKQGLGITASVGERDSELALTSAVAPPEAALAQARQVLADLYGGRAELALGRAEDGHRIAIRVPHERH
jgi:hypothetical protein